MHHFPEYRKCSNMIVDSRKKSASIALEGSDDGSVHDKVYHLQENGALENNDMELKFKLDNDIGPDAQFWTDDRVKIQKMVETIPCPQDGDPHLWCAKIMYALIKNKLIDTKLLNTSKQAPDLWYGHLIRLMHPQTETS